MKDRWYTVRIPTTAPDPERLDAEVLRVLRHLSKDVRVWFRDPEGTARPVVEVTSTEPWK